MLHSHSRESPSDPCRTHRYNTPDHKFSIHSTRAHPADTPLRAPFKRPHTRDRVLVHSQKFSIRRHIPASSMATRIRVSERVECAAVEAPNTSNFRTRFASSRRIVQRPNKSPACLTSRKHHWLAIVSSCNNVLFAGPRERHIRQCTDPDVLHDGAPGIDNADRAVMACRQR